MAVHPLCGTDVWHPWTRETFLFPPFSFETAFSHVLHSEIINQSCSLTITKCEGCPHKDRGTHTLTDTHPGNSCLWSCLTASQDTASCLIGQSAESHRPPTEHIFPSLPDLPSPFCPHSFSTETKSRQVNRTHAQKNTQESVKAIDGKLPPPNKRDIEVGFRERA